MRIQPAPPYQSLAVVYDRLMAHVDYPMWAELVRKLWERHSRDRLQSAFDAACGTGRFLDALREPGMRMGGSDGSTAMLELARGRLPRSIGLSQQDLRDLSTSRTWDLATCLYDSLNYLTDPVDLRQALGRLAALPRPGGLLIFDICTEQNSLNHFSDRTENGRAGEWEWERHSWYDREQRLHHNEFLLEDVATGRRWAEFHVQRIYSVQDVTNLAGAMGLEVLGRYADFSLKPGDERADRVHFVARPARGQA